jgi:hypothetical protein
MKSKLIIILLSLGVAAGIAQPPAAGTPEPAQYSLTIDSRQSAGAKAGSEVAVEIVQRNVSNEQFLVSEAKYPSEAETWFKIYLRDQDGNLAPETKHGRRVRLGKDDPGETTIFVGGASIRQLQPGDSVTHRIILNRLYDLTRPGKYTIEIEGIDRKGRTAKSNVIGLTLTP